jgi:hypothetical protein
METTPDAESPVELPMRWNDQRSKLLETQQLPGYREAAAVRTFKALPARDTRFCEVPRISRLRRRSWLRA